MGCTAKRKLVTCSPRHRQHPRPRPHGQEGPSSQGSLPAHPGPCLESSRRAAPSDYTPITFPPMPSSEGFTQRRDWGGGINLAKANHRPGPRLASAGEIESKPRQRPAPGEHPGSANASGTPQKTPVPATVDTIAEEVLDSTGGGGGEKSHGPCTHDGASRETPPAERPENKHPERSFYENPPPSNRRTLASESIEAHSLRRAEAMRWQRAPRCRAGKPTAGLGTPSE